MVTTRLNVALVWKGSKIDDQSCSGFNVERAAIMFFMLDAETNLWFTSYSNEMKKRCFIRLGVRRRYWKYLKWIRLVYKIKKKSAAHLTQFFLPVTTMSFLVPCSHYTSILVVALELTSFFIKVSCRRTCSVVNSNLWSAFIPYAYGGRNVCKEQSPSLSKMKFPFCSFSYATVSTLLSIYDTDRALFIDKISLQ